MFEPAFRLLLELKYVERPVGGRAEHLHYLDRRHLQRRQGRSGIET